MPGWKQIWVPELVKVGIPGEKFLGKDHEGWEYTRYIIEIILKSLGNNKTILFCLSSSHDLWKKKVVWKSHWKKIW